MLADTIAALLRGKRFHYANEVELQDGIEGVLSLAGVKFVREHRLSPTDIADFFVTEAHGQAGALAVEVKIAGSFPEVTRQLHRYAQHDDVAELLLVTTKSRHALGLPSTLNDKPANRLVLMGGLL